MSSKRHRPHKDGTTPTTESKDRSGVVQFSVSEVAQFSMSLDSIRPVSLSQFREVTGNAIKSWLSHGCHRNAGCQQTLMEKQAEQVAIAADRVVWSRKQNFL